METAGPQGSAKQTTLSEPRAALMEARPRTWLAPGLQRQGRSHYGYVAGACGWPGPAGPAKMELSLASAQGHAAPWDGGVREAAASPRAPGSISRDNDLALPPAEGAGRGPVEDELPVAQLEWTVAPWGLHGALRAEGRRARRRS
jgi:hypothetical protein